MNPRFATKSEPLSVEDLSQDVVGQPHVFERILPYIHVWQGHLSPEGRPAGIFLLLGPTGTGKTRTVEMLAKYLHGNDRHFLRVDCGEFQMDHEVAKLIGAPPGYLGHRETQPMLNQAKLNSFTSEQCGAPIVLFDEIEKGAGSLQRLLLGILDKATLKLGDNTAVNFERAFIFMTSNLGASAILKVAGESLGFQSDQDRQFTDDEIFKAAKKALNKEFSPEFLNRIDEQIAFRLLSQDNLRAIIELLRDDLNQHLISRLGASAFDVTFEESFITSLLELTSPRWGARELKRAIFRGVLVNIARLRLKNGIPAGCNLLVSGTHKEPEFTVSEAHGWLRGGKKATPVIPPVKKTTRRAVNTGLDLDPTDLE